MSDNRLFGYDSFAKLNIMSEVKEDNDKVIPQIMFDLSKKGSKKNLNYLYYSIYNKKAVTRHLFLNFPYSHRCSCDILFANIWINEFFHLIIPI